MLLCTLERRSAADLVHRLLELVPWLVNTKRLPRAAVALVVGATATLEEPRRLPRADPPFRPHEHVRP
jgi:hypothetical protein